ncbi:nucleotidyltransferase substrate binding protein (TIGR01987 family) [Desulfitispora alkaliphila]|uniref:nucleotidyltransferase substrate binding protein n=1 Tax=Desulfitispora alkaliphila TaxID=622674 RepID=UPI003D23027C
MGIEKLEGKLVNYSNALSRLHEALARDVSDSIVLDAVIQRFEFTYELSWKLIKAYLAYSGIADVKTPRGAFKEAFAVGLLRDGDVWIDMIEDRNRTSHTYDEAEARRIYEKVKNKYYPILSELKKSMDKEFK